MDTKLELYVVEIHWGSVCKGRVEVGGNCLQNVMFKRRELRKEGTGKRVTDCRADVKRSRLVSIPKQRSPIIGVLCLIGMSWLWCPC